VKAGEVLYTPPNTPHFGRNAVNLERLFPFDHERKLVPVGMHVKGQSEARLPSGCEDQSFLVRKVVQVRLCDLFSYILRSLSPNVLV
jgi:hypothetical protein